MTDPAAADVPQADPAPLARRIADEGNSTDAVECLLRLRIIDCFHRLENIRRFEDGAVREARDAEMPIDADIAALDRQLRETENHLDLDLRLSDLLNKSESELTPEEFTERNQSIDNLVQTYQLGRYHWKPEELPAQVRTALPAIIDALQRQADEQRARLHLLVSKRDELRRLRGEAAMIAGREDLAAIIRYETMLDRALHRAVTQLRQQRTANQKAAPRSTRSHRSRESSAHKRNVPEKREASTRSGPTRDEP